MLVNVFQANFQIFMVIFIRVFGLFLTLPILAAGVPPFFRAGLAFFTALAGAPMVISLNLVPNPDNFSVLIVHLLGSFLVGISTGFCVQMMVSAFQLSSNIFSTTMGISFSESVDPLGQNTVPAVGGITSAIISLLFIRTESHIVFMEMMINSFRDIPLAKLQATEGLLIALKICSSAIFSMALKLSMPIIGITLLLDLAMGIIGRVAPQFNVMIMGWNIKILLGFLMLWFICPPLIDYGGLILKELQDTMYRLIRLSGGTL